MAAKKTATKNKQLNLRIEEDDRATIDEAYAQSYPSHRMSFNAWMVDILIRAANRRLEPKSYRAKKNGRKS